MLLYLSPQEQMLVVECISFSFAHPGTNILTHSSLQNSLDWIKNICKKSVCKSFHRFSVWFRSELWPDQSDTWIKFYLWLAPYFGLSVLYFIYCVIWCQMQCLSLDKVNYAKWQISCGPIYVNPELTYLWRFCTCFFLNTFLISSETRIWSVWKTFWQHICGVFLSHVKLIQVTKRRVQKKSPQHQHQPVSNTSVFL